MEAVACGCRRYRGNARGRMLNMENAIPTFATSDAIPVTVDNFIRAESDLYLSAVG